MMKKLLYILLFFNLALFAQENYSLSFDGIDDYVEFENFIDFDDATLSFWVLPNDVSELQYSTIFGFDSETTNQKIDLCINKGVDGAGDWLKWQIRTDNGGNLYTVFSDERLSYSTWINIAVTSGSDGMKMYVNGALQTDYDNFTSSFTSFFAENIFFGVNSGNAWYSGLIDEVQIWNTALTQTEIQSYMICEPTGEEDGLVGYWKFNEGSGDTVYDLSGNGNHGIIYGAEFNEDVPERYKGCTDELALNHDESALCDNGSCVYGDEIVSNLGEDLGLANDSITSLELEISVIQSDISLLESQLDSTINQLTQIQLDLEASINDINILSDSIVSLNDLITSLQEDLYIAISNQEDGIGQADVDAAYEEGVASVELPECEEVATQNIPLDLPLGWSMFGYTCIDSVDAMVGFSSISDKIEIVKDEWGLSYLPSWEFNALGSLQFSEGYQIKMIEEVTDFQFCTTIAGGATQEELDAAYAEGAASVIPEDGITQTDVDAAYADGAASIDITSDNQAAFDEGAASVTPEDGVSQSDLDALAESYAGYTAPLNLQIGDLHAGGIVFQINENGSGLVAAMEDLPDIYLWGEAVSEALSYSSEGYTGWHLPSLEELELMYSTIGNGGPEGNIGGFEGDWYWSSSEGSSHGAWGVDFSDGHAGDDNNYYAYRVRVIRSF